MRIAVIDGLIQYINELRDSTDAMRFLVPAGLVLGGLLLGLIFEKLLLKRLLHVVADTKWYADDIVIRAVSGLVTVWFVVAGIYLATVSSSLGEAASRIIEAVLLVVLIFSVAVALTRLSAGFIRLYVTQVRGLPSSSLLINAAGIVIFVLGGLIALQSLGIAITPIITALGVGGLAIALALQETLANFFSGIVIIMSRQLRPGDYVRLESGDEGYVEDIAWRNTTIRSLPNNMIIVPNSKLSSSIVTNHYQPEKEMAVLLNVGVAYGSDLSRVEEVTMEVAAEVMREVEGGVPEFEPFIRYNNFGDFSVDFTVILRSREAVDQYLIKHEFIKRLHRRYGEEGIEIPFPIRTIYSGESSNGVGETSLQDNEEG